MQQTNTPVFIVSTGRSGSKMVAYALAKHSELFAIHEPLPHLVTPGFLKWAGKLKEQQAKALLHESRDRLVGQTHQNGSVYVESSHYCSHFITELAEIYDARFIHLYRRGDAFVQSGLAHSWYERWTPRQRVLALARRRLNRRFGNEWYDHRLKPPTHLNDRVSKLSWLWVEINELIMTQLNKLSSERYMSVALESMSAEKIKDLSDYCAGGNTSDADLGNMLAVAGQKINSAESRSKSRTIWSAADHAKFMSIAGDTMKQLGY